MKKLILLTILLLSFLISPSCVTFKGSGISVDEQMFPNYNLEKNSIRIPIPELTKNDLIKKIYAIKWFEENNIITFEPGVKKDDPINCRLIDISTGKIKKLDKLEKEMIIEKLNSLYYGELPLEEQRLSNIGKKLLKSMLIHVLSGGKVDILEAKSQGYVYSLNKEYKIDYVADIKVEDYVHVINLVLNYKNDRLHYEKTFHVSKDKYSIDLGKAGYISEGAPSVWKLAYTMEVSPDGRFVKLEEYLFDLEEGKIKKLYSTSTRSTQSCFSPDWSKIAFLFYKKDGSVYIDITDFKLEKIF